MPHSSWKMLSAWLRVLTKTSVVLWLLDQAVDFVDGVMRRVPGPGQPLGGIEHTHVGRGAGVRQHKVGEHGATRALRHQIAAQIVRHGHRRREADAGDIRAPA